MLRRASVVVFAAMIGGVAVTPAGAGPNDRVTGPVAGTAPVGSGCAGGTQQNFVGTITTGKGDASINVDVCVVQGGIVYPATGSFVITTSKGHVSGSATGTITFYVSVDAPFAFDLLVVTAERGLAKRGSTLHFTGAWAFTRPGQPIAGVVAV